MSNVTVYAPDGTPINTVNGGGGGGGSQGTQGTQGTKGNQGVANQGVQGVQGAAAKTVGFSYTYIVGTTPPISPSGNITYNDGTLASVTKLYIAANTLNSGTIWPFASDWGSSTNPNDKGYVTITNDSSSTWGQANVFRITGAVIPSSTPDPSPPAAYSYYEIPVVYVGGALNAPQGNSNVLVSYTRTGDQGTQGTQGPQGFGYAQLQGTVGSQGSVGSQGIQGTQGFGYAQSQGTQGATGTGTPGSQGSQGTIGSQGIQGPEGSQGLTGAGSQGPQGTQGTQGVQGKQGSQGVQGATLGPISTSSPITGGPITGTGTIGITQAGSGSDGYLSSTDWNTFNNKQDVVTRQHEFVTGSPISVDYNGHAPLGSSTGDPVWTIYKLEINLDGTSVFYHADANPNAKWDDRASISYSI